MTAHLQQAQTQTRKKVRQNIISWLPKRIWKQSAGDINLFYGPGMKGLKVYHDRIRLIPDVRYIFEGTNHAVPKSEEELKKILQ